MHNKRMIIIITTIVITFVLGSQLLTGIAQDNANQGNTANVVSLDPQHPDSYMNFAPELPATLARMPQIDPEIGLYFEQVMPDLYYVTDSVYTSGFIVTDEGVVIFDVPPSIAPGLLAVIEQVAPDVPITHLVYSHGHTDHTSGTYILADIPDLQIVATEGSTQSIIERENPNILVPNVTWSGSYTLEVGGIAMEMVSADFHSSDEDAIIYLPDYRFLIAIDTVTPGEVPFMNFGGTHDFAEYLAVFDDLLAYDFDFALTGHTAFLATRQDILDSQEYTLDVQTQVQTRMPSFNDRFGANFAAIGFENPNLAYRMTIEEIRGECSATVIENWQGRLSVVDVYADSHCQMVTLHSILH